MASSISGILNTARSALIAQQQASQVTAHNISNATTEGYSRQRAELVASTPILATDGVIGTGVRAVDVARIRDSLLDRSLRDETSLASEHRTRYELLGMVEAGLGEPGEFGLGATLDAFWDAWGDLANDPTNASARTAVQSRGRAVADHLNRLTRSVDEAADFAVDKLTGAVSGLNELARSVADLNRRIVAMEAGGHTASDLRDERDLLLDRMAGLARIQVHERDNGSVAVSISGVSIVGGVRASTLEVALSDGTWAVRTTDGTVIGRPGGETGALLDVLNTEVPDLYADLDSLARAVVESVNAIHATGTNPLGNTGVAFFDDQGGDLSQVTARNIALSADVAADAQAIAAGTGGASGDYRSGANDIALALAQLRDAPETTYLGDRTVGEFYANLVQDLGLAIDAAGDTATVHETLAASAETRRTSVSGVQTDEELIKLMQFQSAYSAAARVVTAADEMLQSLLNMV